MTSVADTSFLIAAFDKSDRRTDEASAKLARAAPLVVPTEVLVETMGVLKAKLDRKTANEVLGLLVRLTNLSWSECSDFQGSLDIHRRYPKLSLVDAIVVRECVRRGVELLSYDDEQVAALQSLTRPSR